MMITYLVVLTIAFAVWVVSGHLIWVGIAKFLSVLSNSHSDARSTPPQDTAQTANKLSDFDAALRLLRYAHFRKWITHFEFEELDQRVSHLGKRLREAPQPAETQLAETQTAVAQTNGNPTIVPMDDPSPAPKITLPGADSERPPEPSSMPSVGRIPPTAPEISAAQIDPSPAAQVDHASAPRSHTEATPPAPEKHALEQDYADDWGQEPPKKRAPVSRRVAAGVLRSFMERRNIRWIEIISATLVVVCSVGLVLSLWSALSQTSRFFPSVVFMVASIAVHSAGQYTLRKWKLKSTSRGILHIALMLIPLAVLVSILLVRRENALPALTLISAGVIAVGSAVYGFLAITAARSLYPRRWQWLSGLVICSSLSIVIVYWTGASRAPSVVSSIGTWLAFGLGISVPSLVAVAGLGIQSSLSARSASTSSGRTTERLIANMIHAIFHLGILLGFAWMQWSKQPVLNESWFLATMTTFTVLIGWTLSQSTSSWQGRQRSRTLIPLLSRKTRLQKTATPVPNGLTATQTPRQSLIQVASIGFGSIVTIGFVMLGTRYLLTVTPLICVLLIAAIVWCVFAHYLSQGLLRVMGCASLIIAIGLMFEGYLDFQSQLGFTQPDVVLQGFEASDWLRSARVISLTVVAFFGLVVAAGAFAIESSMRPAIRRFSSRGIGRAIHLRTTLFGGTLAVPTASRTHDWSIGVGIAASLVLVLATCQTLTALGIQPIQVTDWASWLVMLYGLVCVIAWVVISILRQSPNETASQSESSGTLGLERASTTTNYETLSYRMPAFALAIAGQSLCAIAVATLCLSGPTLASLLDDSRPTCAWMIGWLTLSLPLACVGFSVDRILRARRHRLTKSPHDEQSPWGPWIEWVDRPLLAGAMGLSLVSILPIIEWDRTLGLAVALGWIVPVVFVLGWLAMRQTMVRESAALVCIGWANLWAWNAFSLGSWYESIGLIGPVSALVSTSAVTVIGFDLVRRRLTVLDVLTDGNASDTRTDRERNDNISMPLVIYASLIALGFALFPHLFRCVRQTLGIYGTETDSLSSLSTGTLGLVAGAVASQVALIYWNRSVDASKWVIGSTAVFPGLLVSVVAVAVNSSWSFPLGLWAVALGIVAIDRLSKLQTRWQRTVFSIVRLPLGNPRSKDERLSNENGLESSAPVLDLRMIYAGLVLFITAIMYQANFLGRLDISPADWTDSTSDFVHWLTLLAWTGPWLVLVLVRYGVAIAERQAASVRHIVAIALAVTFVFVGWGATWQSTGTAHSWMSNIGAFFQSWTIAFAIVGLCEFLCDLRPTHSDETVADARIAGDAGHRETTRDFERPADDFGPLVLVGLLAISILSAVHVFQLPLIRWNGFDFLSQSATWLAVGLASLSLVLRRTNVSKSDVSKSAVSKSDVSKSAVSKSDVWPAVVEYLPFLVAITAPIVVVTLLVRSDSSLIALESGTQTQMILARSGYHWLAWGWLVAMLGMLAANWFGAYWPTTAAAATESDRPSVPHAFNTRSIESLRVHHAHVWLAPVAIATGLLCLFSLRRGGPATFMTPEWFVLTFVLAVYSVQTRGRWISQPAGLMAGLGTYIWLTESIGFPPWESFILSMYGPIAVGVVSVLATLVVRHRRSYDLREEQNWQARFAIERTTSVTVPLSIIGLASFWVFADSSVLSRLSFEGWPFIGLSISTIGLNVLRVKEFASGPTRTAWNMSYSIVWGFVAFAATLAMACCHWLNLTDEAAWLFFTAFVGISLTLLAWAAREIALNPATWTRLAWLKQKSGEGESVVTTINATTLRWLPNASLLVGGLMVLPSLVVALTTEEPDVRRLAALLPFLAATGLIPLQRFSPNVAWHQFGLGFLTLAALLYAVATTSEPWSALPPVAWWEPFIRLGFCCAILSWVYWFLSGTRFGASFFDVSAVDEHSRAEEINSPTKVSEDEQSRSNLSGTATVPDRTAAVVKSSSLSASSWFSLATLLAGVAFVVGVLIVGFADNRPNGTASASTSMVLVVALTHITLIVRVLAMAVLAKRCDRALPMGSRSALVFVAEFLLALFVGSIYVCRPQLFNGWLADWWPVAIFIIGMLSIGVGQLLTNSKVPALADPVFRSGLLLPIIPLVGVWWGSEELGRPWTSLDAYSTLLLSVAVIYGGYGWLKSQLAWRVSGSVFALAAFWAFLAGQPDFRFTEHPQFWLLPPSLVTLIFVEWNARRLAREVTSAVRYVAILIAYLSSTAEMILAGFDGRIWPPLVLLGLAIAGALFGIVIRVRAFLLCGASFVFVSLVGMVWHAQRAINEVWPWWVFGIATGVGLIVFLGFMEKHRVKVTDFVNKIRAWDH
jgi:hypothetical protein